MQKNVDSRLSTFYATKPKEIGASSSKLLLRIHALTVHYGGFSVWMYASISAVFRVAPAPSAFAVIAVPV